NYLRPFRDFCLELGSTFFGRVADVTWTCLVPPRPTEAITGTSSYETRAEAEAAAGELTAATGTRLPLPSSNPLTNRPASTASTNCQCSRMAMAASSALHRLTEIFPE